MALTPKLTNMPDLMTVKQVAKVLQTSESYVYELVRMKQLPTTRIGRACIRVPRVALLEMAELPLPEIDKEEEVSEDGGLHSEC